MSNMDLPSSQKCRYIFVGFHLPSKFYTKYQFIYRCSIKNFMHKFPFSGPIQSEKAFSKSIYPWQVQKTFSRKMFFRLGGPKNIFQNHLSTPSPKTFSGKCFSDWAWINGFGKCFFRPVGSRKWKFTHRSQ